MTFLSKLPVTHETLQVEGRRRYRRNANGICSRCLSEPVIPGQRYGKNCKNEYQRNWAREKTAELHRLRALLAEMEESSGE